MSEPHCSRCCPNPQRYEVRINISDCVYHSGDLEEAFGEAFRRLKRPGPPPEGGDQ